MLLTDVWESLDETVQRAFISVARESDRIRTSKILGALAMLSDVDPAAKIINDIQVKSGVELDPPSRLVSESGPPPEDVSFSPCVRETLEFFNMHRIRNVSVGRFATRLLQLGGGNTVLALEKQGELGDYIEKLRNLQ